MISHFEDEYDDDDSSPCGELSAGTIGQIQLAMLTPVGSCSAKDKTGEDDPRIVLDNQVFLDALASLQPAQVARSLGGS